MKRLTIGQTVTRSALPCVLALAVLLAGCTRRPSAEPLFETVAADVTNVTLSNDLSFTDEFNIYTYKDFYAGAGVALGDVNNDGLLDIYVTANQNPNALYLNRGDFSFENITEAAGVGGSKPWSTGVSMADVNGDGFLDIYVTNAGSPDPSDRENELFINNGDLTFTERAGEFGLADRGYSIHAAFFDYDRDGRLDAFVLNNFASEPIGRYDPAALRRDVPNPESGDRLYRNVGGSYVDVTEEAGIFSSEAGFGLGVSVGDLNRDSWMDIYVSNDFFERDYLYMNDGDGTFSEVLEKTLSSISTTSMGGDISDLNNDGHAEIFVSDMLPATEERLKTVADFVDWEQFQEEVASGYHRKFARNTLQYNNGDGTFSEIGRYAGVAASDWSWGGLAADFDLDGLRDLFVTNGFYKDVTNKDHMINMVRSGAVGARNQLDFVRLVEMTPSAPLPNFAFQNLGEMRFANRAEEWGLAEPGFSSGAAYGDLDGDGDLDLVVSNVQAVPSLYRNRATDLHPDAAWTQVVLQGDAPNTLGVGARVDVAVGGLHRYVEQMPQRGFQSSMDPTLHVGLGPGVEAIDSVVVTWPDGRKSVATNVPTRQRFVVRQADASPSDDTTARSDREPSGASSLDATAGAASANAAAGASSRRAASEGSDSAAAAPLLVDVTGDVGIEWSHEESTYNDFETAPLLLHMRSTEGPALCMGDVDGDDRDDVYLGGAAGQAGTLLLQRGDGRFVGTGQPALEADRASEDVDCVFVDVDGDGMEELYVASGSSEFAHGADALADRLYRRSSNGALERIPDALPVPSGGHEPTGVVRAGDPDGDGDMDLFVGTRLGRAFGAPVGGRLLGNDGSGAFTDATVELAPDLLPSRLRGAGITGAAWGDFDGDGGLDLMVAGEWMPVAVFFNRDGRLEQSDTQTVGLGATNGWWRSLEVVDLNGDGALDFVAGNVGLNVLFHASPDRPLQLWADDFNRNGRMQHVFASYSDEGGPYPVAPRQELIQQMPFLTPSIPTFADYAGMTVQEIFGNALLDAAEHYTADQLATIVGWNDGSGRFAVDSLPFRAQWTAMYGMLAEDLDGDDVPELLIGGNLQAVRPQVGAYDAGHGLVLERGENGRFQEVPSHRSGFSISGEVRAIRSLQSGGRTIVLVVRNDDRPLAYRVGSSLQHAVTRADD